MSEIGQEVDKVTLGFLSQILGVYKKIFNIEIRGETGIVAKICDRAITHQTLAHSDICFPFSDICSPGHFLTLTFAHRTLVESEICSPENLLNRTITHQDNCSPGQLLTQTFAHSDNYSPRHWLIRIMTQADILVSKHL